MLFNLLTTALFCAFATTAVHAHNYTVEVTGGGGHKTSYTGTLPVFVPCDTCQPLKRRAMIRCGCKHLGATLWSDPYPWDFPSKGPGRSKMRVGSRCAVLASNLCVVRTSEPVNTINDLYFVVCGYGRYGVGSQHFLNAARRALGSELLGTVSLRTYANESREIEIESVSSELVESEGRSRQIKDCADLWIHCVSDTSLSPESVQLSKMISKSTDTPSTKARYIPHPSPDYDNDSSTVIAHQAHANFDFDFGVSRLSDGTHEGLRAWVDDAIVPLS
ncbi:hypothetical protein BJ138DRAFT_1107500 [Hygrophoropsis aurantiaca]|uniref:Uncharacterized protein n=1 Tax=Hygrophoropsis aurantiaca TaxID=72124 RepID=A0ACB7ZSC2_9AGAM|nr:hypothetical protein BJ138DRAFT_1107500 [Hygrophoropsis aurantiaca]